MAHWLEAPLARDLDPMDPSLGCLQAPALSRNWSAQSRVEKAGNPFLNFLGIPVFTCDRAVVGNPDRHNTARRVGKGADRSPDHRKVTGIPLELHAIALAGSDNVVKFT